MGTRADAAVVSIGAVEFDPETGDLGREFYQVVDLDSSLKAGLTISGGSIYWWLMQSEAARKALTECNVPLDDALIGLEIFWRQTGAEFIWGHGPSFDVAILQTAYLNIFGKHPWKYNAARDTRTIYDDADAWPSPEKQKHVNGLPHNALEDAKAQAHFVIDASKKLAEMKAAWSAAQLYGPLVTSPG